MLPGKLTIKHVEAAEASGQGFIRYMKKDWTLEELYELAGIKRINRKSKANTKLDSGRIESGDGEIVKPDRSISKGGSLERKEYKP